LCVKRTENLAVNVRGVAVVRMLAAVLPAALSAVLKGSLVSLCTVPALSNGQRVTQDEIQVCGLCDVHGEKIKNTDRAGTVGVACPHCGARCDKDAVYAVF
jgi:hypothetical protein